MTNIYCGIGKIPKNSKKGTMKECAEKGQIRLYGLYKVDPQIISKKAKPSAREKMMGKNEIRIVIFKYRGTIKKLEDAIKYEEGDEKQNKKDLSEAKKKLEHLIVIFKKLKDGEKIAIKIDDEKKGSKKGSKKASKKTPKKETKKAPKKETKKAPKKTPKKTTKK